MYLISTIMEGRDSIFRWQSGIEKEVISFKCIENGTKLEPPLSHKTAYKCYQQQENTSIL